MNNYSAICKFINTHPQDWEEILTNYYNIKIKKEGQLAIFNYGHEADFFNPIVQEARGIIIDYEQKEVVCWPFRKFGNHNESYADEIDWNSAKVLEKVDGSIIKLWYNHYQNNWQFSTNGTIKASNANIMDTYENFEDVILSAENFNNIPFDNLNKNYTYIFELVSPKTQIVINYGSTSLYHIGTRSNLTGEEFNIDIGIKKPMAYPITNLQECIKTAVELNKNNSDEISQEGYVVVDKNWNRIKVKSPDYIMMNHLTQMKTINKKDCINMILNNSQEIEIICSATPSLIPTFKYYDFKIAELKYQANKFVQLTRKLYAEYSNDRGAVAKVITKNKLSKIGFKSLSCNLTGEEILMQQPDQFARLIPDYIQEDFSTLFLDDDK